MLYGNENDETLVMLTLAGEQRAYEVLVVRHQKRVMSSAASVARNAFVAEDAAQEAFVTAWMKLDTLAEPQKFGAWTAKIAKNCARNAVMRYHEFIPLDTIENLESFADCDENPAELYVRSEEKRELLGSVERLPARVGEIIRLHYFEGLSVAEIADRLRISAGTVKWQLSDGRKRIRKDMCAVNEKPDDTLTVRVMKKVEELKLWDLRECKDGFDEVYADTLGGVESLPDTKDKFHALADVLVRGVWWLSGKGGDEVLARVKEAAILGKNEEVMQFIVSREDGNASGYTGKIDFIKNHQIPELEKLGFRATLAHEWFWLGYWYFRDGKPEEGSAAYERVRETAELSDLYYAMIPAALMTEERLAGEFKDKKENKYSVGCNAYLLKRFGTALADVKTASCRNGFLQSYDRYTRDLFDAASRCDSKLFDSALAVGGSITGSDGTRLTYVSDSETVTVPAGTFEGCCLWEARAVDNDAVSVYKVYYKDGVGIVRAAHSINGVTDERLLKNYNIVGGEGLLPLAAGNVWEYVSGYAPEVMRADSRCEVMYTDGDSAVVAETFAAERFSYDKNSWSDTVQEIANEYFDGKNVCDVSEAVGRAETLAKTPYELAYTRAACSVARRIMETNQKFNPECTATGHWNFFRSNIVTFKGGEAKLSGYNGRWCFELKSLDGTATSEPLLYNNILGLLQDATNCIWSDGWLAGTEQTLGYHWCGGEPIKTKIVCTASDPITTKAGRFEDCIKLSLDIEGFSDGHGYIAGRKEYYFARGVGIVRTVNVFCEGICRAVYELTSYEGTGEGYMPLSDGLRRRYEAQGLTDGYVGAVEYEFVRDGDGQLIVITDQTGIRVLPPAITDYSSMRDEITEDKLWDEKKYDESRMRNDVNSFRLLAHFIGRDHRTWKKAERGVAWHKYTISIIESFREDGKLPDAWLGRYWWAHFITACTLFGTRKHKEEGYRYLERAFEFYAEWARIPAGEALPVGREEIYGGIKLIKGKDMIELPDGTREPFDAWLFNRTMGNAYYGMTAKRGWEWFNSVRDDELFGEYIERARRFMEAEND